MEIKKTKIVQKVLVNATPIEVFNAFIDPEIHSKFTKSVATGKREVGSKFTAWDGYIKGRHLELEKGKKIVQEWSTSDWPESFSPSRFELILKKVGNKTEIIMIHSEIPATQEDELKQGWIDFYWEPLKEFFKK